jgi:SAM-dependent methyltransferase
MAEPPKDLRDPSQPLPVEAEQLWEINAQWWQDSFTGGADAEYEEQILPLVRAQLAGARRTLDIGCGEGQLARVVAQLASSQQVVGLDPTRSQVEEAQRRQLPAHPIDLVRGEAARLPFPSASFDAALACLVFEHIELVDEALAEVGRVLEPGGVFVFLLNHPLLQAPGSGWIDDQILEEQYWRIGPYLVEDHGIEEVDHGVWIPFIHRPLSRYINALAAAGLYVTHMAEPAPPEGFLDRAAEYQEAAAFPRLLLLRAEKLVAPGA